MEGVLNSIKSTWDKLNKPSVTQAWFGPEEDNPFKTKPPKTPAPVSPTPTPIPKKPNVVSVIEKGFQEWGGENVPAATLAATFAKEAQKNKLDPYLMPALSILETGGGKNVTYPNNILSWGINEKTFQPQKPEEVIEKAASGIGSGRAFPAYQKYRDTGNLKDFVYTYAPPTENDSSTYLENLNRLLEMFRKYQ